MLAALGLIATQQASPTANTMRKIKQLLDYAATHPDTAVTYWSSNMVLATHSDASYISDTKSRSRAGDHFFMASDIAVPENNGAVHTVAQIIKTVMSSAAEAELGAFYINCVKQSRRDIYPRRWDIINPQPQYKLTTPPRWLSSLTKSIRNGPKLWICVSTGYVAVQINANSEPTGARDRLTRATMSQNIMQLRITKTSEQTI